MTAFVAKDQGGAVTYEFDYEPNFLDRDGSPNESILTSEWSVLPDEGSPPGLQVDAESETATTTSVRISGGTPGAIYRVSNRVTTDFNNTDERSLVVIVGQL